MQFGATTWSYEMLSLTDHEGFERVARQVAELPFHEPASVIEVFASMDKEGHSANLKAAGGIKRIADSLGLRVIACGFNPEYLDDKGTRPSPHLTSKKLRERTQAVMRMKRGIEYAAAVADSGQGILTGPSFMRHMYVAEPGANEREHDMLVKMLSEQIVPYAEAAGVQVALEPLMRFEGYLLRPGEDALSVVREVHSSTIGLNIDTAHYTEVPMPHGKSFVDTIIDTVYWKNCFAMHLCEPHRQQYGTGIVGPMTRNLLDSFDSWGYNGPVTLENFCPALHETLRIHLPDKSPAAKVVSNGAKYIARAMQN